MGNESRLAVLLFTDIVGSTDLKSRIGAADYRALLQRHDALFETACASNGGRILKHTGDGFFAEFKTASDAVRVALDFQRAIREADWENAPAARVGIHVGEVAVVELAGRPDVVGVAADVAARVMSLAVGGQVLLTRFPFNDARQFVSYEHLKWMAHGAYLFKGIDEPIEVFEVGMEGSAPLTTPPGEAKAKRVVPHDQEPTLGWRPAIGAAIPKRQGWLLEKRLGEGGFGEVWLGRHERTKQHRVFKFCFDAERLRSFKRELTLFRLLREALGDRPDIAKLYEVKLDESPFFLESEYTDGGNLAEWIESRGGAATVPLAQRLEMMAKIAGAAAAAHSVGILHKDIKPSNVLIANNSDGTVQPRLADFGIGFLADRSQLVARHITETGFTAVTESSNTSRTGTRLYAPPEMLTGKPITTQADVYSLGVMLYQMTVGDLNRPLAEGWQRDVTDPLLREDIAACVEGDPDRRLAGAAELAERIRTLDVRRAQQRRRRIVRLSLASAAAAIVLLGIAAVVAGLHIKRIRAEQARTLQREHEARLEKEKAEDVTRFLQSMFAAADPHATKKADWTVRQLIDEFAPTIETKLADQSDVQAQLHTTVGLAYQHLGQETRAEMHLKRAVELRRKASDTPQRIELGRSLVNLGWLVHDMKDYPGAETLVREGANILTQAQGPQGNDTLAAMAYLGDLRRHQGDLAGAEKMLRDALAVWKKRGESDSLTARYATRLLAVTLVDQKRLPEAEELELELTRMSAKSPGANTGARMTELSVLRETLVKRGKLAEAQDVVREQVDLSRADVAKEPRNRASLNAFNGILLEAADLHRDTRQYGESDRLRIEQAEIAAKMAALDPNKPYWFWSRAKTLEILGRSALAKWDCAAATKYFDDAVKDCEKGLSVSPRDTGLTTMSTSVKSWKDFTARLSRMTPPTTVPVATTQPGDAPIRFTLHCAKLIDSRTFETPQGLRVRLHGTWWIQQQDEPAKEARVRAALEAMINGKDVQAEFEPGQVSKDRNGYVFMYVYLDGQCVNEKMVADGWVDVYESAAFPQQAHWRDLRDVAQKAGRGLWQRKQAPAPPPFPRRGPLRVRRRRFRAVGTGRLTTTASQLLCAMRLFAD